MTKIDKTIPPTLNGIETINEPNTTTYKGLTIEKIKGFITLTISKKAFKEQYTLKARIGIYIGTLIGLIDLNLKD